MKNIFTSIWFLSALITLPIIFFIPPLFEKYTFENTSKEALPKNDDPKDAMSVYYEDLYGNKKIDRVITQYETVNGQEKQLISYDLDKASILFYKNQEPNFSPRIFFGDTDGNGLNEIFGFSYSGDSLFLNKTEVGNNNFYRIYKPYHYFIPFAGKNNEPWLIKSTNKIIFYDIDKDNFDEFIFISSSYSDSWKSALFVYDAQDNSIRRTKIFNGDLDNLQSFGSIKNNSRAIILNGSYYDEYTNSNKKDEFSSYVFLVDSTLTLDANFIKLANGGTISMPVENNEKTFIYTLYFNDWREKVKSVLYKTSLDGTIIDSLNLNISKKIALPTIDKDQKGNIITHVDQGKIQIINNNLEITNTLNLGDEFKHAYVYSANDINEDGIQDFIVVNFLSNELILFSDQFKYKHVIGTFSPASNRGNPKLKKNQIFFYDNNYSYIFSFRKNPYRHLKYPVYAGIYFLIVLVGFTFRKTQELRLKEKYDLQNKIQDLQLQNLLNQLDPHFTFNVLNTIGSFIYKQDKEKAYDLVSAVYPNYSFLITGFR